MNWFIKNNNFINKIIFKQNFKKTTIFIYFLISIIKLQYTTRQNILQIL